MRANKCVVSNTTRPTVSGRTKSLLRRAWPLLLPGVARNHQMPGRCSGCGLRQVRPVFGEVLLTACSCSAIASNTVALLKAPQVGLAITPKKRPP